MLLNLLCLMTGIVGLITTLIAVFRHKANPILNKYLMVFLTVISARFLIRGFSTFLKNIPMEIFTFLYAFFVLLMIACTYLYFRDLVFSRKWRAKDSIHLLLPLIVAVLFIFNFKNQYEYDKTIRIVYASLLLLCYVIYNFFSYHLLRNTIWSKKSDVPFLAKQAAAIKNWTLYLYFAIVVLGLMVILAFIAHDFNYNSMANKYQISFASLFWLVFFIKLLATPELLYGYDFMKIKIEAYKKAEVVLNAIWIMDTTTEITNQKDLKIADSVITNLNSYIHQIESLSFHTPTFRNPALTLENFAKKLNLPIVHLMYVFKYHCALTFVEYKKIVRIHDAIKLLETDFMKSSTMESLAMEVGFSSYKTFYSSFKSITGTSPQEYYKKL